MSCPAKAEPVVRGWWIFKYTTYPHFWVLDEINYTLHYTFIDNCRGLTDRGGWEMRYICKHCGLSRKFTYSETELSDRGFVMKKFWKLPLEYDRYNPTTREDLAQYGVPEWFLNSVCWDETEKEKEKEDCKAC